MVPAPQRRSERLRLRVSPFQLVELPQLSVDLSVGHLRDRDVERRRILVSPEQARFADPPFRSAVRAEPELRGAPAPAVTLPLINGNTTPAITTNCV
jgi:hypothetical protein